MRNDRERRIIKREVGWDQEGSDHCFVYGIFVFTETDFQDFNIGGVRNDKLKFRRRGRFF